jgi:hypothetical protein
MQPQPALGNGALKPGLVLGGRALELIDEGPVDLLDIDPAVLHRLEGVGQLRLLARVYMLAFLIAISLVASGV